MKGKRLFQFVLILFIAGVGSRGFSQDPEMAQKVTLPNGWSLSPAGIQLPVGDLPLNIAVSPDMKYAAVTNNGQSEQSLQLFDIRNRKLLDIREVGKSWMGLVFSDNGRNLYMSGGNDNWILRFAIINDKLVCRDTFRLGSPWPEKISVAGICTDESQRRIYAVTKENNSLYVFHTGTKKILKQFSLGGEGYTCILSPDKRKLYCSCWGCDKIVILDTKTLEIDGTIVVGDNPNDMVIDRKGRLL